MKKAIVLGAGGFIGSHMVKRLKKENFHVTGVDLKKPEFSRSEADLFIIGDFRNHDLVSKIIKPDIDELYQLAADKGGAGYIFTGNNDADVMHNSALINLNVAQEAVRKKVKKYVKTVSCTTSIYSMLTTPELIAYMKSLNVSTYLSTLDSPDYFDMRLLPKNIKKHINKKFNILLKKIPLNDGEKENILSNIKYLNNNIEDENTLLKKFKSYNEQVDHLNHTSFVKTYPELAEWYETI